MFLFDTSFVSHAVNTQSAKNRVVHAFLDQNSLFADQFYISAVTISEIEFGLNLLKSREPPVAPERIAEVERRVMSISKIGQILTIDHHVAREHARLRAAYARLKIPRQIASHKLKAKHVEQWHEDVTAPQLQISENDLWIAATALTHDLVLIAGDSDYEELCKAVPELRAHNL